MSLFNSMDLETVIKVTGYQFEVPVLLEGMEDIAIAHGIRNRDKLPAVAKLSHQPLRLEREFHIVQSLYGQSSAEEVLCRPLDKITLANGLTAFIYEDYGENQLEKCQPLNTGAHTVSLMPQGTTQCMSLNDFLTFAIQCCNCLEMIHKQQTVHGEIKLNAFLWPHNNTVKLWNFGSGSKSLEMNLTSEGWRKTVQRNGANNFLQMLTYMSPEQTGRTSFQPDHRTDLYSLGITFFVALTQSLPFNHSSPMEIVHNVLNKKLPHVHDVQPKIPPIITSIIEKLTSKSPDERYTSAHGLREDLKECDRQLKSSQCITPFPLGKYDIASVFTLPTNGCFGRSYELNLISTIIRRTAYMCGSTKRGVTTALSPIKTREGTYKRVHNNPDDTKHHHPNRRRPTEIIAIYGNTGVGKSTLVRNVQQFARDYGYIAIAKFDTRQPTPYGCLLRCLSIFLKSIMNEPIAEIERFSRMLKEKLGEETIAQLPTLLLDNVPELVSFLEQSSERKLLKGAKSSGYGCDLEGGEVKMKFHSAFIEIFQVMVNFKFVTLFLEDLHQADEASNELLESLLSAKLGFLVILTYRKHEISHSITKLLSNEDSVVSYIKIKDLDPTALMELVRTTMHRMEEIDSVLLAPLVDYLHKKTHGNPFYVCQLLMTLEKKNVIYFTWEKKTWEYDIQEIDKQLLLEMNENTNGDMDIEFLVRRLKELPRDGRAFLKWASFIGHSFKYETVKNLIMEHEDIMEDDESQEIPSSDEEGDTSGDEKQPRRRTSAIGHQYDAINGLQSALQQGFIQPANNEEFRFTHDRYSQAAMMLVSAEKRNTLHLKIATHFMHMNNIDKFWVADHIKAAVCLIKDDAEKGPYRKVLMQAGNKAFDSGAHKLAFSYYVAAQKILSTRNPWIDSDYSKYRETLHLYTRLAEISWFMDYDLTRRYLNTILQHARSAIDRAAAYRVQHRYRWSRASCQESASCLLECLRELGVEDLRTDLSKRSLKELHNRTRNEVLKVGFKHLLRLPICDSRLIRTRFAIMEELCLWAYWTNDMKAMLTVGSRFVLKTLRYGTTPATGVGFVFFGIAAMQLFKSYSFGEQIGEIGVSLCNNYGGNAESGRARYLYAAYLSSWKHPYHKSIPMSNLAMKQGLLGGDRMYSTFAHLHVVEGNLFCGQNMADNLRAAKACLEESDGLGDTVGTSILAATLIRVILTMQGKTFASAEAIFDDKNFQESIFLKDLDKDHSDAKVQLYYYYAMKSIMLSFFGFDEASVNLSNQHMYMVDSLPSARHTHLMCFWRCISFIRLIRNNIFSHKNIDEVYKSRTRLAEWAQHSHAVNLDMYVISIDAELASLNDKPMEAQKLFDLAIRQAKQGEWPIETAVMHELAGEFYIRNDIKTIACYMIEKAVSGYRHIGIYGRVKQLEARHEALLGINCAAKEEKNASVQTETYQAIVRRGSVGDLGLNDPYSFCNDSMSKSESSNSIMHTSPEETLLTLDVVDLASILKSSQVISSEMEFDLLMKQMLGIILENSGADSGVIIVKENTSFAIVGCGSQTKGCEIFNPPKILAEEPDSISTHVSQYCIHAQESLFIHDCKQDSRFSDCTTLAKSCICTPIIHKATVVGCIYIEGAIGSLTSRHEAVLRLLSQQIGISVTNALLFQSIQKVTHANVKMIESQKAALEEARESKEAALHAMKMKAAFLANMSHELRTPFSGFYGMLSLLSETVLDVEQQDIVHTAKESCEMLLKIIDDLLNFSKLEAGKVTLDLGPMIVEELFADTVEILSSLAARKGLELSYIVDPDVPEAVIADSSRLRQILTNLLGNAIKFTHVGGVVLKCHMAPLDSTLQNNADLICLKFEVIDTGIGIHPEQQRQLFEPFSQVDGSTTRMYGGTGLGLSICLQLVRLMMGEVGLESKHDEGSNFWFTVVVNKEPVKTIEAASNSIDTSTSLKISLKDRNILLATQNDSNASMICSLLPDFKVKRTDDMHHAVSQALQEHLPILIIDIPPKHSNFIAHQLQSVDDDPECKLHIVLLYSPATEGHKSAAEATNSSSGRRGSIVKMAKPVRRTKLLRLLEQVMGRRRVSVKPKAQTPTTLKMTDYFDKDELLFYTKKPALIAEDNMVAQKLLRKQLEKMGFTVESANNGEEAVKLWQDRPPSYFCIAFFDHHMPKCDGMEATKRIRALEKGTGRRMPIVALTADIQTSARNISVEAGMDSYLTKPLIPKDLAFTLRALYPAIQRHYAGSDCSLPPSPSTDDDGK